MVDSNTQNEWMFIFIFLFIHHRHSHAILQLLRIILHVCQHQHPRMTSSLLYEAKLVIAIGKGGLRIKVF
jgi:hypothetical protein